MPRQRSKRVPDSARPLQQQDVFAQDEPEKDDSENKSMDDIEEDSDEHELNRLVLGDEAGFLAQLDHDNPEDQDQDDEPGEVGLDAEVGLDNVEEDFEGVDDADLFFLDDVPSAMDASKLVDPKSLEDTQAQSREAAAWEDSDDERLMISLAGNSRLRKLRVNQAEDMINGKLYTSRLRQQFQRLNPVPEWAIPSERPAKRRRRSSASSSSSRSTNDMDIDDEDLSTLPIAQLLRNSEILTRAPAGKRIKRRPEVIDIQRTRDIPTTQPSAVTSLSFHPQFPVILSSGPASTLYLHHIAPAALPTPNPLLTSVHISSVPLHTSAFLPPQGNKIFFSGRRRFFHTWDLESGTIQKTTRIYGHNHEQKSMERFKLSPCGRYMGLVGSSKKGGGIVNVLDANTTQWIAAARIEGRGGIADFAWWSDGEGFTIAGKGGEVGEWSMQNRTFIALWIEEGTVGNTVLTLGGRSGRNELGGDRWLAVGSSSGIVNIYDRRPWVQDNDIVSVPRRPEPTKRIMQLTTATSCLEISPDGQLLIVASRWKKDSLKLVHLPSCTVFRNWPTSQTPFGRVCAVAFSSGSDMLAVGNDQGKIRLWEIRV